MLNKIKSVRWWLMVLLIAGVGTASTGCIFVDHGHDHHDGHWDRR